LLTQDGKRLLPACIMHFCFDVRRCPRSKSYCIHDIIKPSLVFLFWIGMQNHILAIPVDWYKSWSYIVMISKEPTECGRLLFLLLEHSYLGLALLDIFPLCLYKNLWILLCSGILLCPVYLIMVWWYNFFYTDIR
jgi:hypothetical protein